MSQTMGSDHPPTPNNPKADAKAAKAYAKASRPWYKKKRYWLLAIVVIFIIAAVSGGASSDSGTDASSSGGGSSNKPSAPVKPDMTVEAQTIIKDFEQNEASADAKYGGKVLRVTGVVDKVDTDFLDDEKYIVRVGGGGDFDLWTVDCEDQSSADVAKLKQGQDISVQGEFDDGGDLGILLADCRVL